MSKAFIMALFAGALATVGLAVLSYVMSSPAPTFAGRWPVGLKPGKPGMCAYSDFQHGWSWKPCVFKVNSPQDMMCKFGHLSWMDPQKCA